MESHGTQFELKEFVTITNEHIHRDQMQPEELGKP
jgi:hypothetical protein